MAANPPWPPWHIGHHATQTFGEIEANGPARAPAPFPGPTIHPGYAAEEYLVSDFRTSLERREELYLVRADDEPDRGYRKIRSLQLIERNGAVWGEVVLCLVLNRREDDMDGIVFLEPSPDDYSLVVVKALSKRVVDKYLSDGGLENPYKEISALQAIGDGVHVINCIEALEDRENLWIVTPYCEGGDLYSVIHEHPEFTGPGLPEPYARQRFREILECLHYLQRNGVCHGDISVENILIKNGRCILIDLGCCYRVPLSDDGRRVLSVSFRQRFGKRQYMAPEIFFQERLLDFDGFAVDIWSAGVTLFHMLTGELIEETPIWVLLFHNLNSYIFRNGRLRTLTRNVNGVACNLVHLMLRDPRSRSTLADAMQSAWATANLVPHVPMDEYFNAME